MINKLPPIVINLNTSIREPTLDRLHLVVCTNLLRSDHDLLKELVEEGVKDLSERLDDLVEHIEYVKEHRQGIEYPLRESDLYIITDALIERLKKAKALQDIINATDYK